MIDPNESWRQVKAYSVPNGGNPPLNVPDTLVYEGSDPYNTRATVWDRNTNAPNKIVYMAAGAYVEEIDWASLKTSFVAGSNGNAQKSYGELAASQYISTAFTTVDPRNPGSGCSLDGQKVLCSKLIKAINRGTASFGAKQEREFIDHPSISPGILIDRSGGSESGVQREILAGLDDFIEPQTTGGTPQKKPCSTVIPTDPNDRSVWNTLVGESEEVQTSLPPGAFKGRPDRGKYGDNQVGAADYLAPNAGLVNQVDVFNGMRLMVDVIQNRLTGEARFRGKSWQDVVTATYFDKNEKKNKYEFEGYPYGAGWNQATLGDEGSEACVKAKLAAVAIETFRLLGVSNQNIHSWRGIKQRSQATGNMIIRQRNGAIRVANTDFF